jgi:hypothetical protein
MDSALFRAERLLTLPFERYFASATKQIEPWMTGNLRAAHEYDMAMTDGTG